MKSQRRRRQVRPLTIYGFRRNRPKYRGVWLALLVLASLSVLPRVLSPIAERLWGTPKQPALSSTQAAPQPKPATPEAGSAFAAPEPEPAVADTTAAIAASDSAGLVRAPSRPQSVPSKPQTSKAASAPARPHRSRIHKKTAAEVAPAPSDPAPSLPPPPRPRLVPPPR